MKKNTIKYIFTFLLGVFLIACSTKKDKWINRNFQALNTKYNVNFNGDVALQKGVVDLKSKYEDNFWEILPIERMSVAEENMAPGQTGKNVNFDRAESKATKAIQKRSMNIDGKERNSQIDEAYLILGKARYYEQRFIPALEAFNYILDKYPDSDQIFTAKIWREKTNMRLDNDALAIQNLTKLLKQIKVKEQVFSDVNATLAQAFLNLNAKDSAISYIKIAEKFTKSNEEKARFRFIKGQLFESLNQADSAKIAFESIVAMQRKSPKSYLIQATSKIAKQFDYEKGDTIAFLKTNELLLQDRENRPFLDELYFQLGHFYDNRKKSKQAIIFYNKSLKAITNDGYLATTNYKNLAQIYFNKAKYQTAGQYYDSTLVGLKPRTKEYIFYKKKKDNLADVIKYEDIAQRNDSILNVFGLSSKDRVDFYEDYILKLRKYDLLQLELAKKEADKAKLNKQSSDDNEVADFSSNTREKSNNNKIVAAPVFGPKETSTGSFYFYNSKTVEIGKKEFKKKWGNRLYKGNWRLSLDQIKGANADQEEPETDIVEIVAIEKSVVIENPKYDPNFYIKKLPTTQKSIDSLSRDRNFAYYQLGVIYKEKFKEYQLAASKLESLLNQKPEERLVLPAMYNLFKIYEIINKDKALIIKNDIISKYPNSRYAAILINPNGTAELASGSPEVIYQNLYDLYQKRQYFKVLDQSTKAIAQLIGEEIVPKLELLKANVIGNLKGVEEFKVALNYVALSYPNVFEGKEAEKLLQKDIPILEKMKFYDIQPDSWKIIYKYTAADSLKLQNVFNIIKKFTEERTTEKLYFSKDIYTMTESFIVIHGLISETKAKDIATVLKEYKDYNIKEIAIVISNENYKIVQIKKNLPEYLKTPKTDAVPQKPFVPEPNATPPVQDEVPIKKQSGSKTPPSFNRSMDTSDDPKPVLTTPTPAESISKPIKKD